MGELITEHGSSKSTTSGNAAACAAFSSYCKIKGIAGSIYITHYHYNLPNELKKNTNNDY